MIIFPESDPHKTQRPLILDSMSLWKLAIQETHRKLDSFSDEELNQYVLGLLQKLERKASLMKISFSPNNEFNLNYGVPVVVPSSAMSPN